MTTKKFFWIVILIPAGLVCLLLAECTHVHVEHDFAARKLLADLRRVPLPKDARPVYEDDEVGNYFSSTGDATDFLAYRIFVADTDDQSVFDFFAPLLTQHRDFDLGVFRADKPPLSPYLPFETILEHIPKGKLSRFYVLYGLDRSSDEGLWDMRGW